MDQRPASVKVTKILCGLWFQCTWETQRPRRQKIIARPSQATVFISNGCAYMHGTRGRGRQPERRGVAD